MGFKQNKFITVSVEFEHQTAKALLINDGDESCWIPKSVIEDGFDFNKDYQKEEILHLKLPEWIAKKNNLI